MLGESCCPHITLMGLPLWEQDARLVASCSGLQDLWSAALPLAGETQAGGGELPGGGMLSVTPKGIQEAGVPADVLENSSAKCQVEGDTGFVSLSR